MATALLNPPIREVCPKIFTNLSIPHTADLKHGKRWSTESWLRDLIEQENFQFKDFLNISFHNPNKDVVDQYLDNKHIRNVILDFYYKNQRPKDKIRLWFFTERESMFFRQGKNQHLDVIKGGNLHIHILMERVDPDWWLKRNNRKIGINKRTIRRLLDGECSTLDVMREALTNHLRHKVWRFPKSYQGADIRDIGEIKKRVHYVNKALSSVEFDKWEHIDFENSDLPICPLRKPKLHIHSN